MTTMNVRELIEHLKQYDQDLPVFDADWEPMVGCHIVEDFPLGDYANPDCEYLDKVLILSNDPNM